MRIIHFNNKGWRARFDDGFNEENLRRIADAFAYIWADARPGSTILVGYDTRYNGRVLAGAVASVMASYGLHVLVSDGPCPTPALGWSIARDTSIAGGVMLTASSASCEHGGITARAADGGPISDNFYDAAARIVSSVPVTSHGKYSYVDMVTPYLEHLRTKVDEGLLRSSQVTVVVDPLHGSARGSLAGILRSLGCRVREIHNDENPDFGGLHPMPSEPWVDTCEQAVVAYSSNMGLVLDGDGDRFGVIDEKGRFVSPHKVTPLIMEHLVNGHDEQGRVVATFSSSAYVKRQADRLGCEFTAVPMGFSRIYREFVEGDVLLGAEEYGGIAYPEHLPERDGLLSSLYMVEYVARSGKRMSELADSLEQELGPLHYIRRNIQLDAASIQAFRNILPGLNLRNVCGRKPISIGHSDGLVLRFADDSWVQLRPSRTEALVRACAEAPTVELADRLADEACSQALRHLP